MNFPRNVVGIAGWSGSGKTSLIVRLIPELVARGYRVATLKHAHHDFDLDTPGKDSFEHRAAGASEVAIGSSTRWALMGDYGGGPEMTLEQMLARMSPADIYLVEGYKGASHAKIEVHRREMRTNLICTGNPSVIAVASDAAADDPRIAGLDIPVLDLGDTAAIADFIVGHCGFGKRMRGAL